MEVKTPRLGFSLLKGCVCTCIILSLWCTAAAEEKGKKNESNSERYPLVVFDFERVELPFVICLWVLIASLAKIGRPYFNVKQMSKQSTDGCSDADGLYNFCASCVIGCINVPDM